MVSAGLREISRLHQFDQQSTRSYFDSRFVDLFPDMSQYLNAEHKDYCMLRMQVMERDARLYDRGEWAILEAQLQRRILIWD